jgi:hypothetical protein
VEKCKSLQIGCQLVLNSPRQTAMLMFPPQGKFAADDKAYWSTKEEEAGLSLSAAFTIVLFGNVFHTFT